jgi:membrane protein implicated in regulation of membrane protease activity
VTDQAAIARIVADCDRYWRETGVPSAALREMRLQLEQHLIEAAADGGSPEKVVGADLAAFAEAWASEYRKPNPDPARWSEVTSGRAAGRRGARWELLSYVAGGLALVGGVVAGSRFAGGDQVESNETWRWVWTVLAIGMGVGEMFTAGFFLLPFAIGAAASAILAWAGVGDILSQALVFFGVSSVSFAYLRRYVQRQDRMEQPRVGANRWVGATGLVLAEIDSHLDTGMVRIEGEQWRATTDSGERLQPGTRVVVRAVRGARLVVDKVE